MKEQKRPAPRAAAIYARVSTTNGQSTQMQIRELKEYCRNRNWKIVSEFIDEGFSGRRDSRPALDALMAAANRRRFSIVLVWKFDRFARSVPHLLRALDAFRAVKIDFVSVTEQIDTSTASGVLAYTVLAACASLEASLIAERVKAGLRNAQSNGIRLGRPPLRELTTTEIAQIRRDRKRLSMSFKSLALKHRISTWTAFCLCKKGN